MKILFENTRQTLLTAIEQLAEIKEQQGSTARMIKTYEQMDDPEGAASCSVLMRQLNSYERRLTGTIEEILGS